MDMDQRTRLLGGRGGRVILLGDGTEIVTGSGDDDDVDMGEAEEVDDSDLEEQIKKGQAESNNGETNASRVQREGTPGPKTEEPKKDSSSTTGTSSTPAEPKMTAPTDGPATE
jgi:protein phosphatase 2C family protein 2/3